MPMSKCQYLVNYLCVHVALLVTRSGLSQDDATSPSSIMTSSTCRNLRDIFLILTACGSLTDPANGQVTHTTGTMTGQTAVYSCNTGYNLVGDSILTCQAGNWSGSAPTRQGVYTAKQKCRLLQLCNYPSCASSKNVVLVKQFVGG